MACRTIQEYFSAYLDGELPPGQMEMVARHLEGCPTCRREYQVWQQLWDGLAAAPEKAPPDLRARILARLPHRAEPRWRTMALAASLLVGIFLGGRLGWEMHQTILPGQLEAAHLHWEGFQESSPNSLDALLASYDLENGGGS
jgi:anti-sigma factor (TIGR02949 family)